MSEHHPSSGTPEYLEHGTGAPLPPETAATPDGTAPKRRSRRLWWISGGALVLVGGGAAAWAAMSFFQQGAQPAEALPASTVGYVSVDLDPSGGQKIDAFRTLNKFPAFKKDVGVNSVDDIRRKVGESLLQSTGCSKLTYDHDIDPWLGDRAAGAAVQLDGKTDPVIVVQVKDADKARSALSALIACDQTGTDSGFVIKDGWATVAQSQEIADEVSQAAGQHSLADDATYQKWTKAVGDAGVVNAYASPEAGRLLAKKVAGLFANGFAVPGSIASSGTVTQSATASGSAAASAGTGSDPFSSELAGFKGGAATIRFTGDGLELAVAMDGTMPQLTSLSGSTTGGELVSRLPADTAAAIGISLPHGWLSKRLDAMTQGFGVSSSEIERGLAQETGLKVPDDIETLLGSGVALSVSKSLDLQAAENSADGTGVPVAATVKGDPTAIQGVLDKIRSRAGDISFLGTDSSGDLVVMGPTADYRKQVLAGGSLGDDSTFTGVVPDAAHASSVFFLNVDDLEPMIKQLQPGDQQTLDNVAPLRAVGMSTTVDGGVTKLSFKLTTD